MALKKHLVKKPVAGKRSRKPTPSLPLYPAREESIRMPGMALQPGPFLIDQTQRVERPST